LDIKDGKTVTSVRPVPLHSYLERWLTNNKLLPEVGQKFNWPNTTADAFNKSFNRFSKINLVNKYNISETDGKLSHHSFRHGMSTRLHEKGLSELEVAHVVGHKQGTVAQTTSGKTYIKKAQIPTILGHIEKIEPIELPNTNAHES
jgi:Phage integrase family.